MQVKVLPDAMAVFPAFGQAAPAFTTAFTAEIGNNAIENMQVSVNICRIFQFRKFENCFMNALTQEQ